MVSNRQLELRSEEHHGQNCPWEIYDGEALIASFRYEADAKAFIGSIGSTPAAGAPFNPAEIGWEPYSDSGFIGLIGPLWMRRNGENLAFAFLAEPKHRNRRGVVQGGMLMTFADRALGTTVWYAIGQRAEATVQLDTHFVDAVRIGEFVEAHCEIVRRTRSILFMRATLMVGSRVVATANGVWKVLGES